MFITGSVVSLFVQGPKRECELKPDSAPKGQDEKGAQSPRANWRVKIEKAKEARQAGQELRKGKPVAFTPRHRPW